MKPIFDEWDQQEFAKVFSGITGFPLESIFRLLRGVVSWLRDATGKVQLVPVPGLPVNQLKVAEMGPHGHEETGALEKLIPRVKKGQIKYSSVASGTCR